MSRTDAPVVVDVVRNGFVEGSHDVSLVLRDADGATRTFGPLGAVPVFPRSTAKPLQAVGMLRAGLAVDAEALALACASHAGSPAHTAVVVRVLGSVGLTPAALLNTPWLPSGPDELSTWLRAGKGPERVVQECSGKHAAMLATCVAAGWRTGDYLAADHPLQVHLAATVVDLTGVPVSAIAFAALATAPEGPSAAVGAAVREHPVLLGGEDLPITAFLRAVPGVVAKSGAEGVLAAALPDGRAFALKVGDGSARAVWPAAALALRELGVPDALPVELAEQPLAGGSKRVGGLFARLP